MSCRVKRDLRHEEDGGDMSHETKHGLSCSEKVDRRKFLGALVVYTLLVTVNMMLVPSMASGAWTAWLGALAVAAAWFWSARAVQVLAVVVLLGVQTTYELQFIWKF